MNHRETILLLPVSLVPGGEKSYNRSKFKTKPGFEDSRIRGFKGFNFHTFHSALRSLTPWPLESSESFS
ncbi:MAG: hypothetical protein A2Y79_07655 [Deltaproteobacteria bacterium RBG_13_43_22]|nr:MAG: hypothetical protein A2Y79_07655 [Deltaproteobacteria bacterium RBG_13_43_22]